VIGYWHHNRYVEAPVDDSVDVELYKMHVVNGTVPRKGIPYTKITKPVRKIPSAIYATNPKTYIREFELLNNLKEIPA
jgi:hypothetical protein